MEKKYTIGQLRGAFAAGARIGQTPNDPSQKRTDIAASRLETILWNLVEKHGTAAFTRDGHSDDVARTAIAVAWDRGRGEAAVHQTFDRIEDRLAREFGDFLGPAVANSLEHRIAAVMPWPM